MQTYAFFEHLCVMDIAIAKTQERSDGERSRHDLSFLKLYSNLTYPFRLHSCLILHHNLLKSLLLRGWLYTTPNMAPTQEKAIQK